jgi:hypothetical protein
VACPADVFHNQSQNAEDKGKHKLKMNKAKKNSKAEINKANYRFKHTCPLANTIAINAAASMTHDNGFHIKPRNLRNLFSCTTTTWVNNSQEVNTED